MITKVFTINFNQDGDIVGGNNLFLGTIKQFSQDTYKLRVFFHSSFPTNLTVSANIERADEDITSYVLPYIVENGVGGYTLLFSGWAAAVYGELLISINAVSGDETISVFGTVKMNVEYSVKSTTFDLTEYPDEYTDLLSILATKVNRVQQINGYDLQGNITLKASDLANDVPYLVLADLTGAFVPTTRTINGYTLANNITLTTNDLANNSGYITSAALTPYALITSIPTAVSDLTNDSQFQTATQLKDVFKDFAFSYAAATGVVTLTFTEYDGSTVTKTIDLPTELLIQSGYYDDATKEIVLVLANNTEENPSEIRIEAEDLLNLYFDDNSTLELYTDTGDNNKLKFRIRQTWIDNNITTKLDKTGDGKDVTVTFTMASARENIASTEKLSVVLGKISKYLNDLGTFAYKSSLIVDDLPTGTVVDANYVHTDNNLTNQLVTDIGANTTARHTHTNKAELDKITTVVQDLIASEFADEQVPTVQAVLNAIGVPDLEWDGNADTLDGFDASTGDLASTIPVRDSERGLQISGIKLSTSTPVTMAPGVITWNSSDGTIDVGLQNGVVMQVGEEIYYQVRNSTGSTISNGTAVYASGVTVGSGRIEAAPAIADGSIEPIRFLGLVTHDINDGVNGKVTHFGYVRGLDTRGTNEGENWQEGDILYVSSTNAGKLTKVKPDAPLPSIIVAIVINRHQTTGSLFVRPSIEGGFGSNVALDNPTNNELLAYNSSTSVWENKTFDELDLATKTYVDASTPNFIDGGAPDTVYLPQDSLDGGTPDSEYA
jgi:hypothetical protein